MKKLYPFLVGMTLVSLGSIISSGSVAQVKPSNQSNVLTQPIVQAQSTTTSPTSATCPLPTGIAVTFLRSECRAVVLAAPKTYYRYYSTDANKFGRYLTTDRYERNIDVIKNLALKQEWGNQATMMLTVTVPSGTTVFEGIVAPQDPQSCYGGGGQQTFIEDSKNPNLVWSSGTSMKKVEPFQCP
jgi:hypothetical protein